MYRVLGKTAWSVVLLGIAMGLLGYSVCTYKIAAKDLDFQKNHAVFRLFPESWVFKGNAAYYDDLDSALAVESFRNAVSMLPLRMDAWFALAKTEMARGNVEDARRVVDTLAPLLAHVSTWKWQEFLLANDMHDEKRFASCLNFILNRLPHRIQEACYLSLQFYGDWGAVLPHLEPESRPVFLRQLMRVNETDVALSLWQTMEGNPGAADQDLRLQFCQFLLSNKRLVMAKKVWESWAGKGKSGLTGIYDGGFEREPLNTAFGWRRSVHPEVVVERSMEAPHAGNYCMHLRFRGTQNVAFHHVSQVVPVDPGRTYHLSFAQKSRNLTTDQGVFLQVSGHGCSGLNVQSEPVMGSLSWRKSELEVPVPQGCEAVLLQIVRKESLKFDSKISGDYWIDGIALE